MKPLIEIPGFQIIEFIGEGSFGVVYRAKQISTGQNVAIKLLRLCNLDSHSKSRRIARFQREITLCAELRHPYIVQLIDRGTSAHDWPFVVFEYVRGDTLQELLKRNGSLRANQLKVVMGQVLEALAFAHEKGIIHRDLKPGNIIVTTNNVQTYAKVLDFGISGFLPSAKGPDHRSLTLPSETLGTPSYAAPEQLRGEPPNPKSDLYAWGLIFLECLTGQPVMTGSSVAEIFHRQLLSEDIPLPAGIASHPISALLRRVLAKRTQDRVGDASRLLMEFQQLHLDDLVGQMKPPKANNIHVNAATHTSHEMMGSIDRRQLTVLCCSLNVVPTEHNLPELEALDTLQRIHKSLCADIAAKYSGYLAGGLGDYVMFYFGYPESSDTDARLAVRTVLDLAEEVRRRCGLLEEQQNIRIELRAGIHSGPVHIERDLAPFGQTPNMALRLATTASAGHILISGPTYQRLLHHVDVEPVSMPVSSFLSGMNVFSLIGERRNEARFLFTEHQFLGRKKEMEIIRKAWISVLHGRGKAILIKGEAGIGKSSLIGASCIRFRKTGAVVVETRCFPEYRNSALHPVFEIIRRDLGITEELNPAARAKRVEHALKECGCHLETMFPVFCSWFSLPLPSEYMLTQYSPQRQKEFLFEGLTRLLFRRSDAAHWFVIEDLHWADPTTLEFLGIVIKFVDKYPLMILATARPEFESPWRDVSPELISLAGLPGRESSTLLDRLFEGKVVSSALKRRILERAGGLPLFIEELARAVLERGVVRCNGDYLPDKGFDLDGIPDTLIDLLSAHIQRLGLTRETAQLCSVIGREFEETLLAEVSLLDIESLQTDLDSLVEAGILLRRRGVHVSTYFFRHSLLRDAAYVTMPASTKKAVHERIAHVLEDKFKTVTDERPAVLALHHAGAHAFDKAVHYGTQAAMEFLNRSNNMEAIRLAHDVLGWIGKCDADERPEAERRISAVLTQALMEILSWTDPEAKDRIDHSRRLLDRVGGRSHVPTLWSLMTYHYMASNRKELKRLADEFVLYSEASDDLSLRIASQTFSGLSGHGAGKYAKAKKAFELVRELYQPYPHGDHCVRFGLDTRVWYSATLALVKWFAGKPDEATRCSDEAITWARNIRHIPSLCIALLHKANLCQYMNDKRLVAEVVSELNILADQNSTVIRLTDRSWIAGLQENPKRPCSIRSRGWDVPRYCPANVHCCRYLRLRRTI